MALPLFLASQMALVSQANNLSQPQVSGFKSTFLSGHGVVQFGGFWVNQGENQQINIQDLVGNYYTVNSGKQGSALAGIGYYLNGLTLDRLQLNYGLNAFYLGANSVSGEIAQEQLYTNLSYRYKVQNIPLYLDAKAILHSASDRFDMTLDAGIGSNFMRVNGYNETPLNNYSIPDNAFGAHTNTNLAATAGIGARINNVFGKLPLECGYRFFYLGKGRLAATNNQLLSNLNTGNVYANAILCSISI